MLHACVEKFDMMKNLKNILGTKQDLNLLMEDDRMVWMKT